MECSVHVSSTLYVMVLSPIHAQHSATVVTKTTTFFAVCYL